MNLKLEAFKTAITSKAGRQILITKKHSPTILFGVGVVGVVATVVLACRATLYLDAAIDETNGKLVKAFDAHETKIDYTDKMWTQDKVVIRSRGAMQIAKLYWPAVTVGVISIGCLSGSHIILSKRNVGLTAAYAAVEKGFAEYRARVTEEFGADKERELRYGSETREIIEETDKGEQKVKTIKHVGPNGASIYAKYFDEYSKNWVREAEYNRMFIQVQQTWANDKLRARGHVFLNEVYDSLGLDRSKAGACVGWVMTKDGSTDNYIDFGLYDNNQGARDFVNGREGSILLDFNVDGTILDKI